MPDLEAKKSVFSVKTKFRSRTTKENLENPLTHPEAFRPHFHEFYVYTGPEADNLDEDSSLIVLMLTAFVLSFTLFIYHLTTH
jgi:hypothetical protein